MTTPDHRAEAARLPAEAAVAIIPATAYDPEEEM